MNEKRVIFIATTVFILLILFSCNTESKELYEPISTYEQGEELSVGKLTTNLIGADAFGDEVPGLNDLFGLRFFVGNALFRKNWVSAPASTTAIDGLGPTFNARACSSCHNKDGRGLPLKIGQQFTAGFLMRISIPGLGPHGGPNPVPGYGNQLQDQSNMGIPFEGKVSVRFQMIKGSFADGKSYELRKPIYTIYNEQFESLQNVLTSPRVAQQIIGLGLIDALSDQVILANADEFDNDGDGISGKPNYVWNAVTKKTELGRFGWKANQPNLKQQIAGALSGDMGLTTSIFPDDNCPNPQQKCKDSNNGGTPEVTDKQLENFLIYNSSLSVPVRRNFKNKTVLRGKKLFRDMQCVKCHVEQFITSNNYPFNKTLQNIKIRPFSDFLLHDMGDALADNRPDFKASGKEWRTQPLWGIGLIKKVNRHTFLLHDGRARNVEEAILWHGGEAEKSKEMYVKLTKKDRISVLAFINSL